MATNTMHALKRKMHHLKTEKENASDKVDQLEQKLCQQKLFYDKQNEEVLILQKRIVQMQNDLGQTHTQLQETNNRLEAALKLLATAESEVGTLTKRLRQLEEDFDQAASRLEQTSTKLDEASKAADESERGTKVLENRNIADDERIQQMEKELEMTVMFGEEADRKFELTVRRFAVIEVDLDRTEATLETAEAKILELEEELKVVSNNRKSLEIAEQEAALREDQNEMSIRSLTEQLKMAESRVTLTEKAINTLQKEVDRLEAEVVNERDKFKLVSTELDLTFTELTGF